jgi:hypothetical protein
MNFGSINDVRRGGFVGEVAVSVLQASGCGEVPDEPGVYLVLRADTSPPDFLPKGTGGRYKGRDSNVEIGCLRSKWVEGAIVLNIGKAGGPGTAATLKGRLKKYMRFGEGKNSGHSGGRYVWQLRNSCDLLLCWKVVTAGEVPRNVEKRLIKEFRQRYDKRPFANLKD